MEDFIKYRAFVEAARTGSITAAALSLDYTQPGISHMISYLEKSCGFLLLYRSKQGVALTENGERIYKICQEILDKQTELNDTISQINGSVSGVLRIGSYLSVLTHWGNTLVEKMDKLHPLLQLHFFEGNRDSQLSLLRNNEIDVGIFSSSAPEEFDFLPIHKDPIVVIFPQNHEFLQKKVLTTDDLLQSSMLIQSEGYSEALKRILGEQYTAVRGKVTTKSDQAQIRLVESGMGIGVVGEMIVSPTDAIGVRKFAKPYARTIGLAIPSWKPVTPALREFIKLVCDTYQDEAFNSFAVKYLSASQKSMS